MSAQALLIIAHMTCAQPVMNFETFFLEVHHRPIRPQAWEDRTMYVRQLTDTAGDYIEYRVARAELCMGDRR